MADSTVTKRPINSMQLQQKMKKAQHEVAFASWEKAAEQRRTMQSKIDNLGTIIDRLGNEEARDQLAELRKTPDEHNHSISGVLTSIPLHVRGPSERATTVVHKVIYTTELLELILSKVDICDLWTTQLVNHHFSEVIKRSLSLQRKLGVKADTSGFFSYPSYVLCCHPISRWYVYIDEHSEYPHGWDGGPTELNWDTSSIMFRLKIHGKPFERLGSKCASILLVQPPVQQMTVFMSCCESPRQPVETINAKPDSLGITVGDINESAKRILESHSRCTNAGLYQHNLDGTVRFQIRFQASIKVCARDPDLLEKLQNREKRRQWKLTKDLLRDYIAAKQAANSNGEAIPTFDEFKVKASKWW